MTRSHDLKHLNPINSDYRVVLVQPSKHLAVRSLFTFHKNDGLGAKPPLAILSLATVLMKNGFTQTSCLDAQAENLSIEETVARLQKIRPDLVGISVWTDFWYSAWKTANLLRTLLPKCRIVLGGPHCLVYPMESLTSSSADYLVAGDGEETLLRLVQNLSCVLPAEDIPGLWRKSDLGPLPPTIPIASLSTFKEFPHPNRRLLPIKLYSSVLQSGEFETTMVSSRGCPNRCIFCKMTSQKVFSRTAEQVIREFQEIHELGITDVQIYDDTFSWSHTRVKEICEGILDLRLPVRWAIRDRVNRADRDLYRLMKKAGCYRIHFGVESGSPRILDGSRKGITLHQVTQAIQWAKEAGFITLTYFMFGFPEEQLTDIKRTIRFSRKLDADYAVFAALIPYPGTELYAMGLEKGIIPEDFWLRFAKEPQPDFTIPFLYEQHFSQKELLFFKDLALRKFYLRPRRILKELASITSFPEFKKKWSMGVTVLSDALRSLFGFP